MSFDLEIIKWLKNQKADNSCKPCFSVGQVGQVGQLAQAAVSSLSYKKNSSRTGRTAAQVPQKQPSPDANILIPATESTDYTLDQWLTLATNAKTLAALETILSDFSNGTWALVDKAALSDAYTPTAKKLIENESASKWQVLENLACLCFKPSP